MKTDNVINREIINAYVWIRENNNSIPDEILDLMKHAALNYDSLLSVLKGLTKEITQPGYPLHSGMTIIWLDKAREAIKQAEEV